VLLLALVLPTAVTWVYFVALDGAPASWQQTAYGVGKTLQFALPVAWIVGMRRGWPTLVAPHGIWLGVGAGVGLAIAAAMAAIYFAAMKPAGLFTAPAAAITAKVNSFGAGSALLFALLGLFYSLLHSLLEEYYWRWFVFGELTRWRPWTQAAAISSLAFAAHHVLVLAHYFGPAAPLTWLFTAAVAAGGTIWAWIYWRSGCLWSVWLSHALVDAAIFALGYDIVFRSAVGS